MSVLRKIMAQNNKIVREIPLGLMTGSYVGLQSIK
jgi:hypothetical protein